MIWDHGGVLSEEMQGVLLLELGDVMWYVTTFCEELGVELNLVAEMNIAKLADRKKSGALHGDGDYR